MNACKEQLLALGKTDEEIADEMVKYQDQITKAEIDGSKKREDAQDELKSISRNCTNKYICTLSLHKNSLSLHFVRKRAF